MGTTDDEGTPDRPPLNNDEASLKRALAWSAGFSGRLLAVSLAIFAVGGGPVLAAVLVLFKVSNHKASDNYYFAVATVLPVLLLSLVVQQGYFFGATELPRLRFRGFSPIRLSRPYRTIRSALEAMTTEELFMQCAVWFTDFFSRFVVGVLYPLALLTFMAWGEFIALRALALHSTPDDLPLTAAPVAGSFAAVVAVAAYGAVLRLPAARRILGMETDEGAPGTP